MGAGNVAVCLPANFARSHMSSLTSSNRQLRTSVCHIRGGTTWGCSARHIAAIRSFGGSELKHQVWGSRWQSERRYKSCAAPHAQWKQDITWSKGSISKTTRLSGELYSVILSLEGHDDLLAGYTKPGQFVQIRVKESKPAFLAIASSPKSAGKGELEFLIKAVEGTTTALICDLKVGDEADVSPVMGKGFNMDALHPPEEWPCVIIFATGSGISPIRSLIEHGFEASSRKDVRLYYGADDLQKMAYKKRFEAWEASGVKIIPVLSQAGDGWTGEKGYVQEAFKRSGVLVNGKQTGAVLVGQKEMSEEVTAILLEAGVTKDKMLTNF